MLLQTWIVGTLSGKLEGVFCLESERQFLKRILGGVPNGTGLSPNRQGWLSKPSGKGCGTIHDESGSIPPSTPDK
jgi:hypothetical protein